MGVLADSSCWRVRVHHGHHSTEEEQGILGVPKALKVNPSTFQVDALDEYGLMVISYKVYYPFQDWMMGRYTGFSHISEGNEGGLW